MWNVECGMIGYADEEFINEEFILHSTFNTQHCGSAATIQHSTFNIKKKWQKKK